MQGVCQKERAVVDDVVPLMIKGVKVSKPKNPVHQKPKFNPFLGLMLYLTFLLGWVRPLYEFPRRFACWIGNKLGGESYRVRSATVGISGSHGKESDQADEASSIGCDTVGDETDSGVTWLGQYTRMDLKKHIGERHP